MKKFGALNKIGDYNSFKEKYIVCVFASANKFVTVLIRQS